MTQENTATDSKKEGDPGFQPLDPPEGAAKSAGEGEATQPPEPVDAQAAKVQRKATRLSEELREQVGFLKRCADRVHPFGRDAQPIEKDLRSRADRLDRWLDEVDA